MVGETTVFVPLRKAKQDFHWEGVERLPYKEAGAAPFKAISRHTLFSDPRLQGELRCFEIEPGGGAPSLSVLGLALLSFACKWGMRKIAKLVFGPGVQVDGVKFQDNRWLVSAFGSGTRSCPCCGASSTSRYSWHVRQLQDLPIQGVPVTLKLQVGRWRCRNEQCARKTFVEKLSATATPFERRTRRVAELVRLFGHAAGGQVSERLLARLAMPASDNTILRQLKRHVGASGVVSPIRVAGIDDWTWRNGFTYGTIIVDLERRNVVDVLPVRSAEETAQGLKRHPEIEIVSRDRCGGSMHKARVRARRGQGKWQIASICCKTCGIPSSGR